MKCTSYLGSWFGEVERCEELLIAGSNLCQGATSSLRYRVVAAKFRLKDVARFLPEADPTQKAIVMVLKRLTSEIIM